DRRNGQCADRWEHMPAKAGGPFLRVLLAAPFVTVRRYVSMRRSLERDRLHARRGGGSTLSIAVFQRIDAAKAQGAIVARQFAGILEADDVERAQSHLACATGSADVAEHPGAVDLLAVALADRDLQEKVVAVAVCARLRAPQIGTGKSINPPAHARTPGRGYGISRLPSHSRTHVCRPDISGQSRTGKDKKNPGSPDYERASRTCADGGG